ncbi:MAG TPA: outer membrane protein assembly factor BamA [Agitococcus sp.]|uniref:outer membrane protein assembly factor BamA n=1 Tax=uncultured Agitococcus sp. TaxID=1506599 RepID=UPI00260AB413|nr:outer membrane protein assembly factor BamA [uncultured Agitococcus sp.]HNG09694.1 outer membrane protein assembly factor BamA [Agitococcus sp.]HRH91586.1 outer membrane protein assembly factor BamA [Agitococcus sp.]
MISQRLLLTTAALCLSAQAVAETGSFTVKDIQIQGLMRVSPASVYAQLPINTGDVVDDAKIALAIRQLFATGSFEDISLARDGDVLIVNVIERPSIASIKLEGNKAIDTDTLMKALKDAGLVEGEVLKRASLDHIKGELERVYFGQGRYDATISVNNIAKPRNRVAVDVKINEGESARITTINILGNKAFSEKELLKLMQSKATHFTSFFKGDDKYARERLMGDLEALRSFYLDSGYINFAINSHQVTLSQDKKSVFIDISLNEGDKYQFGEPKILGEVPINEQELQKLLLVKSGRDYSQQLVTASSKLMKQRLGSDGYLFSEINPIPEIDEQNKKVNLSFFVNPNKKTYVRRVNFQGNNKTDDHVLRREMRQFEGTLASTDKIDLSKLRLQRLGFFKDVTIETPKVPNTTDQVDLNVKVQEQPSGTLTASVGYSGGSGMIFSLGVSQNNFLGTGNKVGINLNRSETSDNYNISFSDPYFTVDGISRGYNIYYRNTKLDERNISRYATDSQGASLSFGYPIDETKNINFSLGIDQTDITLGTLPSQLVQNFVTEHGNSITSYMGVVSWNYNSLNRGVFATKGASQRLALEFAVPPSDVNYTKLSYAAQIYFPINDDFTVRLRTDLGYGDSLPFYKNYFAGGYGSVRGYRDNTLGPRSPVIANDPDPEVVGGNVLVENSVELIVPTPFAKNYSQLRTVFFVDSGMVYYRNNPPYNFDLSNLRYSAGISIAWLTAIGPLSFSLSRPFNYDEADDRQNFQFTIGQPF